MSLSHLLMFALRYKAEILKTTILTAHHLVLTFNDKNVKPK